MSDRARVVFDTSTLIGAMLKPNSVPRHALLRAVDRCQICATDATLEELRTVLQRPKFERYLALAQRLNFLDLVMRYVRRVEVDAHSVQLSKDACRDPRVPKWDWLTQMSARQVFPRLHFDQTANSTLKLKLKATALI